MYKMHRIIHERLCIMRIEYARKIMYNDHAGERGNEFESPLRREKVRIKMLSKKNAAEKLARWEELSALEKEILAEKSAIEDDFKQELDRKGVEILEVGNKKVRWTSVVSNRFDSTGFKAQFPELYKAWTKQVASRRFSVA